MSEVTLRHVDGGIAVLALSRPARRNAFNQALRLALAGQLEALTADASVRAIVITGEGPHFSVGGDLDEFAQAEGAGVREILGAAHRCVRAITGSPVPVVAAVEGSAAGGAAGLLLACDAAVVTPGTRIAFPFLKLGLVPDWGCVHLLRSKIGRGAAARLLLRPSDVSGETALDLGIADAMAQDGAALDAAIGLAADFAALPREAWRSTRAMLQASDASLEAALQDELSRQERAFESPDFSRALQQVRQRRAGRAAASPHQQELQ